jgi:hypothetical protein
MKFLLMLVLFAVLLVAPVAAQADAPPPTPAAPSAPPAASPLPSPTPAACVERRGYHPNLFRSNLGFYLSEVATELYRDEYIATLSEQKRKEWICRFEALLDLDTFLVPGKEYDRKPFAWYAAQRDAYSRAKMLSSELEVLAQAIDPPLKRRLVVGHVSALQSFIDKIVDAQTRPTVKAR